MPKLRFKLVEDDKTGLATLEGLKKSTLSEQVCSIVNHALVEGELEVEIHLTCRQLEMCYERVGYDEMKDWIIGIDNERGAFLAPNDNLGGHLVGFICLEVKGNELRADFEGVPRYEFRGDNDE